MADNRIGEPRASGWPSVCGARPRRRGRRFPRRCTRVSWRRSESAPGNRASSVRRGCAAAAGIRRRGGGVRGGVPRGRDAGGAAPGGVAGTDARGVSDDGHGPPEPGPVGRSGRPGRREQHRGGRRRSVGRCDARAEAMGLPRSRRPSGHRDVAGQFAVEDAGGEGTAVSGKW